MLEKTEENVNDLKELYNDVLKEIGEIDESTNELIDLNSNDVGKINIKKNIPGKKISSVEVLVKIKNNN